MTRTLRGLAPVNRFLSDPALSCFETTLGRGTVKDVVSGVLSRARSEPELPSFDILRDRAAEELAVTAGAGLTNVINATGVLIHTNLGRSPLGRSALDAIERASGYSNLEYDLRSGERDSRYGRLSSLLQATTGGQDGIAVNNCAAAMLLILDTFAKGREVIAARSELVEIGGGFRLPDVLERSGARLVEIGTTNKVYLKDFQAALSVETALLLRTHRSNFSLEGFVADVAPRDLAAMGRRAGIPIVEDLGSGALVDLREFGLTRERTVQDAVADGIDLVAFSGDKALGGPQAGLIVGRASYVARLRANPLLRALRVDKLTIAALAETLRCYATGTYAHAIPLYAMLAAPLETLRRRAESYAKSVGPTIEARVVEAQGTLGGGTSPRHTFASAGTALRSARGAAHLAAGLRSATPPVIARVADDAVILDVRTIPPERDKEVRELLQKL